MILDVFKVSANPARATRGVRPATPVAGCPAAAAAGPYALATNNDNDVKAPPWNVPVCDPTADNAQNSAGWPTELRRDEDLMATRDFAEANVDLTAFGITTRASPT